MNFPFIPLVRTGHITMPHCKGGWETKYHVYLLCCCKKQVEKACQMDKQQWCHWSVLVRVLQRQSANIYWDLSQELSHEMRWYSGKEFICQCRRHRRWGFDLWVRKIPWRRKWQPTPVFSSGKVHGHRSLMGIVHGLQRVRDDWMTKDTHTRYRSKSPTAYLCKLGKQKHWGV